jgi:hypothetical protein
MFKSSSTVNKTKPATSYPLVNTPSIKDLKTQSTYTATVTMTSIPMTVTVIEEKTVTVPIFHTKTRTKIVTTSSPHLARTSTITLTPITSSINVAQVSLAPRLDNVEYSYQFQINDGIQVYLDTENSVLVRVPSKLPDFGTGKTPRVVIAVRRDDEAIPIEIREFKENMAFISWSKEECHDQLSVHVYTKPESALEERVVVDYTHPLIDPKLWEILGQTQREAWRRMAVLGGQVGPKVKSMAKEIQDRATDPANRQRFDDIAKRAKEIQDRIFLNAERQMDLLRSQYQSFSDRKSQSEKLKKLQKVTENVQKQMDGYLKLAQDEALLISDRIMRAVFPPSNQDKSQWVKRWYEAVEKKATKKTNSPENKKPCKRCKGRKMKGWR